MVSDYLAEKGNMQTSKKKYRHLVTFFTLFQQTNV